MIIISGRSTGKKKALEMFMEHTKGMKVFCDFAKDGKDISTFTELKGITPIISHTKRQYPEWLSKTLEVKWTDYPLEEIRAFVRRDYEENEFLRGSLWRLANTLKDSKHG